MLRERIRIINPRGGGSYDGVDPSIGSSGRARRRAGRFDPFFSLDERYESAVFDPV